MRDRNSRSYAVDPRTIKIAPQGGEFSLDDCEIICFLCVTQPVCMARYKEVMTDLTYRLASTVSIKTEERTLPTLGLCPKFFTSRQSKQKISNRKCNQKAREAGHKLGKFMTGGFTVLHEMTHLYFINEELEMVDAVNKNDDGTVS